jgi:Helicase HerA, central domain
MLDENEIVLGSRESWGQQIPISLSVSDLSQHVYVIGKSGTGKTTLLLNLILQTVHRGLGVAVIDPHGDLARSVIDRVPKWRAEDVVYFDPGDLDFPIGLNVLRTSASPHLVASGIVSALKGIWHDSWGPRLEYILYAAVAALIECENVSLLGLQRMLADGEYRAWVVRQVKDPMVRAYWAQEFGAYDRRFMQDAIAPIQNKVGQLLMSPVTRNILGQVTSTIDARFMMDHGRIFVANLSKGRLGEDKSNLLGALLVSQFQLAAMARANIAEGERRPFQLFVDEFQSFTSDAFAAILSEARKYRLGLVLSHQYLDQLRPGIRDAILGNVGSMVSFRTGHQDADRMALEFGGAFPGSRFSELNNHEILVRLLSGGQVVPPTSGMSLPPIWEPTGRGEHILARSRSRFARTRTEVEDKIRRWLKTESEL